MMVRTWGEETARSSEGAESARQDAGIEERTLTSRTPFGMTKPENGADMGSSMLDPYQDKGGRRRAQAGVPVPRVGLL